VIGIRPKQLTRLGEFYLEEAILDILLQAFEEKLCIGAAEISKRSGIFRERGSANIMNDAIATGILIKLNESGRVERCTQNNKKVGGWQLTKKEYDIRKDD
jgi:hypothetical protein